MSAHEEFRTRWLAFVERHTEATPAERAALAAAAVAEGLPDQAPSAGFSPTVAERVAADVSLIRADGTFDAFGYWRHSTDLHWNLCGRGHEELEHFAAQGWRELRLPSPDFDLWFYWNEHLDPTSEDVNPYVHFVCEGRRAGLATQPEVRTRPAPDAPTGPPRRACLFAAYDVDGVVDPTVVAYLAELSRHADVYYLADCPMADEELAKVAPYTRGRWALRHGRYDFGSYSMLAKDLVGWDVLDTYDEVLLTNDSCYLVQPLDQVFARMDATACDWWGLQATYENFRVTDQERRGGPLPIDEAADLMRQLDLWRYSDFIHVGSYFLAFRRPVLDDPDFRRRLDTVTAQSEKTTIILKYEIGFSRLLLLAGYHLATYVDGILAYHPVYRESAFELMRDGFPLLKRQFLYENPFSTPDLRLWKERVLEVLPDADVAAMERNLRRVAPSWNLYRSFALRTLPDGSVHVPAGLGPDTFDDEDRWVPKHDHWWVFPVDPRTGVMSGPLRGVFEAVRHDASVKKVVLTGSRRVKYAGANVEAVPAESAPGQMFALRAGTIFTTVGPRSDVNHPLSAARHRYVHVGNPTQLPVAELPLTDVFGERPRPPAALDADYVRAVAVSGELPRDEAAATHASLEDGGLWLTGSPRVDLLVAPEETLAADLRGELAAVRQQVAGRRLVVVAPLSAEDLDLDALAAWAGRADVVVALVPPPGWDARVPAPLVDVHAPHAWRPDTAAPPPFQAELVWRLADVVATGWAADVADAAMLPRPVVALPGAVGTPLPVRATTDAAIAAIEAALADPALDPEWLAWARVLHAASDGRSGTRVVRALKETYLPLAEWEREISAG